MRGRRIVVGAVWAALVFGLPPALLLSGNSGTPAPDHEPQGTAADLAQVFESWRERHVANGGDRNVIIGLSHHEGLSAEATPARGSVRLDLYSGMVSVELRALAREGEWDVWLVEKARPEGDRFRPGQEDRKLRVARLKADGSGRTLRGWRDFGPEAFQDFQVDAVVVARAGEPPGETGILYGAPPLFQWLHTQQRLADARRDRGSARLLPVLGPRRAFAQLSTSPTDDTLSDLIRRGAELFFFETFEGNGRTCGTCHPAENNFTIDPQFIASLPDSDKLFVAEQVENLKQLEKPKLLRRFGVILENVDGFEDPTEKFTLRGVPHTLGMTASLTPAPPVDPNDPEERTDGTVVPPVERTGWSGDGAPGDGSLFMFATGAVTQHFTKDLARDPEQGHFREPTTEELRAMEAFQLSLGRTEDPDLAGTTFRSAIAERGKEIFLTNDTQQGTVAAGKCGFCHFNAGANTSGGTNNNFATDVEELADVPFRVVDPTIPFDGGFGGRKDVLPNSICELDFDFDNLTDELAFGNCSFNTASLVEAADTPPFFHNNAINTLEEAVNFYNSRAFDTSPSGQFLKSSDSGGIGIRLEATQVEAIAAMLRVLNSLSNVDQSMDYEKQALSGDGFFASGDMLELAAVETEDSYQVLEAAGLHLADAVPALKEAERLDRKAAATTDPALRQDLVEKAQALKAEAIAAMVV